jgi:3-hydroxyisobutyrate dehydrogenase-like beta-hydroxyacid dehydrogenase
MRPDSLVIEMSTVLPETSRQLAEQGSHHEIHILDVTISGSTPVAEQGALVLFGGGDQAYFQAAESIFRAIARKYFCLGPSGSGATMKLVVNTLLGIGMQAIAEALALGEKAGLERNRLLEVLSQTAVVAPAHLGKLQRAMKRDYSPQFPLRLMNKDFGLILSLAAAVGAHVPATDAAFEVNARRFDEGKEEDFSAVILQMEKQDHLLSVGKSNLK